MFAVRRASFALRPLVLLGKQIPKTVNASMPTVSATSRSFSSLLDVIKSEIKHEQGQDEIDEEFLKLKSESLKGYNIDDKAGSSRVTFSKAFKNENIVVSLNVEDAADDYGNQEYDEENEQEEESGPPPGVDFVVNIEKGDQKLVFDCVGGTEGLQIRHVHLSSTAAPSKEEDDSFFGPDFNSLDQTLQEEYFKYLDERGINDDFSYVVFGYAQEKEQKEYLASLKAVQSFLSK